MKRKPIYTPTETHLSLNPPSTLLLCSCGVTFVARPENHEDDPDKCLTCNRKGWSKLWEKKDEPKEKEELTSAEIVPMRRSK